MSPDHKSMLADILGRNTRLPVLHMEDGQVPQVGHIYVVPPNFNASIEAETFKLSPAAPNSYPKPSINRFFKSLAENIGARAIGVVLSGTGSDGSEGLAHIQAEHGTTIVQQPSDAKYDGMPQAAIDNKVDDYVAESHHIGRLIRDLYYLYSDAKGIDNVGLNAILNILKKSVDIDFSEYKKATLERRIRRRMFALGKKSPNDYVDILRNNDDEVSLLTNELLITVTSFFRDPQVFENIGQYLDELLDTRNDDGEFRIWVAGCATGEEAYTYAMVLNQRLEERGERLPVHIFATDIDSKALEVGRRAIYSAAAIERIPKHYRERYFKEVSNGYEVSKRVRDQVVFARHNLIDNPPFLRIDLLSCRNTLIYFTAELQRKVFQRFAFSLKPKGLLVLGGSESHANGENFFEVADKSLRLYKRKQHIARIAPITSKPKTDLIRNLKRDEAQIVLNKLSQRYELTLALCDHNFEVIHTAGDVGRFFHIGRGSISRGLADLTQDSLRAEILVLISRYRKEQNGEPKLISRLNGERYALTLMDCEYGDANLPLLLIEPLRVAAENGSDASSETDNSDSGIELPILRESLEQTQAQMQALLHEVSSSHEEMLSLQEEAEAANEELQATNEELEAANEELQATNEELMSLNEELNVKSTEVENLNTQFLHLYQSLDFPIIVCDKNLRLQRFNLPAEREFELRNGMLGQRFSDLTQLDHYQALHEHIAGVLRSGKSAELQLNMQNKIVRVSIVPHLDAAGQVDILVLVFFDITEIVRTQHELQNSQAQLNSIMARTNTLFTVKDLSGHYTYANQKFLELMPGIPQQLKEVIGQTDFELFPHQVAQHIWEHDLEAMRTREPLHSEVQIPLAKTSPPQFLTLAISHRLLLNESGKVVAILNEATDVSAIRKAEQLTKLHASIYSEISEAILVADRSGAIEAANSAASKLFNCSQQQLLGQHLERLLAEKLSLAQGQEFAPMAEVLKVKHWAGEAELTGDNESREIWLSLSLTKVADDQTKIICLLTDIQQLKKAQQEISYLASHDSLTGLANRTRLKEALTEMIRQASMSKRKVAVMLFDLDYFKRINDASGHHVGDLLLQRVTETALNALDDKVMLARLGGDEFVAVLSETNMSEVQRNAEALRQALDRSFILDGRESFISASIGVAFYPDDGDTSEVLLKSADTAMYRAKESGRNQVAMFKAQFGELLAQKIHNEQLLLKALEQDQINIKIQAQVDATNVERIPAAEVLLYVETAQGISNGELIETAEMSNLIVRLDERVLEKSIACLKRWRKHPQLAELTLSVNISSHTLNSRQFADKVVTMLREARVPSRVLRLEIIESTLLESSAIVLGNIQKLLANGISFSIDDFGTGYSSLQYLARLSLEELKIDQSFVQGIGQDAINERIIESIVSLAESLELEIVAEGVETQAQVEFLHKAGVTLLQGFLFARPEPIEDFEARFNS